MNTKQATYVRDLSAVMLKVRGLKVDYDMKHGGWKVYLPKDLTGGMHVNPHQWVRVKQYDNVITLEWFYNWGETGSIVSLQNMGLGAHTLGVIMTQMLEQKVGA